VERAVLCLPCDAVMHAEDAKAAHERRALPDVASSVRPSRCLTPPLAGLRRAAPRRAHAPPPPPNARLSRADRSTWAPRRTRRCWRSAPARSKPPAEQEKAS
jgi:hypothetical protein